MFSIENLGVSSCDATSDRWYSASLSTDQGHVERNTTSSEDTMHGFVLLINKVIPSSDYGRAVELGKDGFKGIYKYFLIDSQDPKYGIVLTRSWREMRSNNTARRSERKRDRVAAKFRRILDVALCYVILAVIAPSHDILHSNHHHRRNEQSCSSHF